MDDLGALIIGTHLLIGGIAYLYGHRHGIMEQWERQADHRDKSKGPIL